MIQVTIKPRKRGNVLAVIVQLDGVFTNQRDAKRAARIIVGNPKPNTYRIEADTLKPIMLPTMP